MTATIQLVGRRPAGIDTLTVPANSAMMKPENRLHYEEMRHAHYIQNPDSKSLELGKAWDHDKFGRSVMANVMMDEQWKCAHRDDTSAPNVFLPEHFPAPASSTKRGQARRNCRARLIASGVR